MVSWNCLLLIKHLTANSKEENVQHLKARFKHTNWRNGLLTNWSGSFAKPKSKITSLISASYRYDELVAEGELGTGNYGVQSVSGQSKSKCLDMITDYHLIALVWFWKLRVKRGVTFPLQCFAFSLIEEQCIKSGCCSPFSNRFWFVLFCVFLFCLFGNFLFGCLFYLFI